MLKVPTNAGPAVETTAEDLADDPLLMLVRDLAKLGSPSPGWLKKHETPKEWADIWMGAEAPLDIWRALRWLEDTHGLTRLASVAADFARQVLSHPEAPHLTLARACAQLAIDDAGALMQGSPTFEDASTLALEAVEQALEATVVLARERCYQRMTEAGVSPERAAVVAQIALECADDIARVELAALAAAAIPRPPHPSEWAEARKTSAGPSLPT